MQEKTLIEACTLAARVSESLAQVISDYELRIENCDGHSAVLECIRQTADSLSERLSELERQVR